MRIKGSRGGWIRVGRFGGRAVWAHIAGPLDLVWMETQRAQLDHLLLSGMDIGCLAHAQQGLIYIIYADICFLSQLVGQKCGAVRLLTLTKCQ